MKQYSGDKQCKRYNKMHKQMKEDYREWETDKLEEQKWIEDEYELDSQELIDDYKCSWEYALEHASETNVW